MRRRARPGLRLRLAASHASLALVLVVAASVLVEQQIGGVRRSEAVDGAQRDAEVAAARVAHLARRPDALDHVVTDEARAGRGIAIVAADGAVSAGTVPASRSVAGRVLRDALDGAASGRAAGGRVVVAAAPVVQGDEVVGAVVISEPAPAIAWWRGPASLVFLPGLGLVLVAALAGWSLARRVARPIETLTADARRVALGDLASTSPVRRSGVPEADTLSAAVGRLVERSRALSVRARERDEHLGLALRRLSHQLRTPVAVLALRLDELARPDVDPSRRVVLADVVERQLDAVVAAAGRVAELARGEHRGTPETVDVGALVESVVDRLAPLAASVRTDLRRHVERAATVTADRNALDDAVANLVDNALRYTPPGGRVGVTVATRGDDVVVEVADSGPGIAPNERSLVVRPWTRGRAGATAPGSGLGLSLASDAAAGAGGRLEIADSALGGALVRLVLPPADQMLAGSSRLTFSKNTNSTTRNTGVPSR